MKMGRTRALVLLTAAVVVVAGFLAPPARLTFKPETKITMSGTSTMHDWTCDVKDVTGFVEGGLPAKATVSQVELTIPVASIDCGKAPMNNRLRSDMKAKDFPNITFKLTSAKAADATTLNATGNLTVKGVTKPVSFPVTILKEKSGAVHFKGSVPLKISNFEIKPPVFLGMKTGDDIKIDFDAVVGQ